MSDVKKISGKITSFEVVKKDTDEASVPVVPDIDPLTLRIESRPEGALEAVSEKISMVGAEGKKKIYVLVSFMPVTGIQDGKEITIERPVEFFIPSGQLSTEHQWVTATMRSLSLAARGGYATQALQDLRKVAWDKGLVRCGWNKYGKPGFHDSEVAAIAWAIQQILQRRGFLDDEGLQEPLDKLIHSYNVRYGKVRVDFDPSQIANVSPDDPAVAVVDTPTTSTKNSVGNCPECRSDLTLMDGCPTCVEGCGWSKCG